MGNKCNFCTSIKLFIRGKKGNSLCLLPKDPREPERYVGGSSASTCRWACPCPLATCQPKWNISENILFCGEKIQIFAFEGIADFIARIMKVDLSGRKGYIADILDKDKNSEKCRLKFLKS